MPRIKIIFVEDYNGDDYGNYDSRIIDGTTAWEEVSEEDYQFLKSNVYLITDGFRGEGKPVIIREDALTVPARIDSIKERLAEYKRKNEEREALEQSRRDKAAEKRREAKLRKEARDFERLKAKFETGKDVE